MSKRYIKACPLLEGLGIPYNEGYKGMSVCQLCPLPYCIYDRPGPISFKNKQELFRILDTLIVFKKEE